MNKLISTLSFSLLLSILSLDALAEKQFEDKVQRVNQIVSEFFDRSGSPGLSVAIGQNNQIVWAKGFGLADLEQNVPVTTETKFRYGSVAKPLTSYALAKLVESKKVGLDDSIYKFLPIFPKKKYDFSIRQLAGHVAGIRHYKGDEAYLRTRYDSVTDGLSIFKHDKLLSKPGENFHYSSYGYNLLAAVIESASGQSYLQYMQHALFEPMKMNSTTADRLEQIIKHRSRYYKTKNNLILNEPEVDNSYKWSSGGLLSTPTDIAKFGLAVLSQKQISKRIQGDFWNPIKTKNQNDSDYALGWRVVDGEYGTWIGHGGGSIGGTSQFWLWPEHGIAISMVSNLTNFDYKDVLLQIKNVFDNNQK